MTQFEEQKQLLKRLYQLMEQSIEPDYETARCVFGCEFSSDARCISVGSELSYWKSGEKKSLNLKRPNGIDLFDILPRLHTIMKMHMGVGWRSFMLTIKEDRSYDICMWGHLNE